MITVDLHRTFFDITDRFFKFPGPLTNDLCVGLKVKWFFSLLEG